MQKQIETSSSTVRGLAVKQQIDSMARQFNNFRVQKDSVIVTTPLEETATESAQNHELVQSAQTARITPFDTSIRQAPLEILSDALSKEAKRMLSGSAETLENNRKLKVELTGSFSQDGPKASNCDLAMRRTNNVRTYLLKKGIHVNQVFVLSYGTDKHSEVSAYAYRAEVCVLL